MVISRNPIKGLCMINVVLISNDKTVQQRLAAQTDLQLTVLQASTVDETVRLAKQHSPDIIISEQKMENNDIFCHFLSKTFPSAKNIILVEDFPTFTMLQNSGFKVRGYLTPEQKHLIVKAVRVVHDGEAWLPRKLVAEMLDHYASIHSELANEQSVKLNVIG